MTSARPDFEKSLRIPTSPGGKKPRVDLGGVEVCSVHGQPSVRRLRLAVQWRPDREDTVRVGPASVPAPRLIGNFTRNVQHVAEVVLVEAVDWPVCAQCRWRRRRWIWPAAAMFWGGLVVFATIAVLAVVRGEPQAQLLVPGLLAPVIAFSAAVPFVVASWLNITRVRGTPDGSAVIVDDPHPAFRAAVAASFP